MQRPILTGSGILVLDAKAIPKGDWALLTTFVRYMIIQFLSKLNVIEIVRFS
jgi:hypothetical protein